MIKQTLGYDDDESKTSAYARFFNPLMAELPPHVLEALSKGAMAHELLPPIEQLGYLQSDGYSLLENGYTIAPDGSARIACLTKMPGVTPAMWEWWFAWHGSEAQRYKLWHPLAHVDVGWADGRDDLEHYIGRTSNIVEYLGSDCMKLAVSFVAPAEIGFDEDTLVTRGETAICGRISLPSLGMETGWLVHHIRPVPGGSEMRSRFWIGGKNINPLGMTGSLGKILGSAVSKLQKPTKAQAQELMIHDAQEMNHLTSFLPELYETFH